jgi:uracil-DNA glycosylase
MKFWKSGEWQVVEERLDDLSKNTGYNPSSETLFSSLKNSPYERTRVCICGPHPYGERSKATGMAFSVPGRTKELPAPLANILREYQDDLHLPLPSSGNLSKWAAQGVLLWDCIPTCTPGHALAHESWFEWDYLTIEILQELSRKDEIVFWMVGGIAKNYAKFIEPKDNNIIYTVYPKFFGKKKGTFSGSRPFSTINAKLVEQGAKPVDWTLPTR